MNAPVGTLRFTALRTRLLAVTAPVGARERVPFYDDGLEPTDFARLIIQLPTEGGHTDRVTAVPTAGSTMAVRWDASVV